MQALSSTSQRRTHAARFANALRATIKARGASKLRVCEATSIPRSNLGYYLAGRNLPTLEVAQRLADVLDADELLRIVIAGRTVRCGRPGCTREFLYEGGKPKVYCSEDCASLAAKMRAGRDANDDGARELYGAVKAEVDRVRGSTGAVSRRSLDAALRTYARSGSKRHRKLTAFQRRVDATAEAIDAMCRGCEPEGLCRTPECPLRAFSPLPLRGTYSEERPTRKIRPAEGAHGPSHQGAWLEAQRAANARRWSRPGEREAQADRSRAAWADPEKRAERGRQISAGRRKAARTPLTGAREPWQGPRESPPAIDSPTRAGRAADTPVGEDLSTGFPQPATRRPENRGQGSGITDYSATEKRLHDVGVKTNHRGAQ